MQNTKLHNGTKRKKRRHRFLFGVLLSALLITGALYGREYDISQLKNIEVMETLSSAVSQFGDRKLPVYSVQTTEKKIALSFDCAWGAEDFDSMMETLDKHNVKATFFMTGGFVSDNPECVKTLVEKGHEPGNHSEHHYDMATITAGEMKTEIMDVHKKVKELTGKDMKVFRPPYGSYNNELIDTVYGCDLLSNPVGCGFARLEKLWCAKHYRYSVQSQKPGLWLDNTLPSRRKIHLAGTR